ncbi:MAG: AgmX/PglI C-terminal domain-containing protein [Oligoflexia bacterium]|nr:AgmX/PglI C-terminal domain-containing protein [Oligoflexia bacterium]
MSQQPVFLRVVKNSKPVEMKQFSQEQIIIGSGGDANLVIQNPQVSPIHAMIEVRNGKYFICDLGTEHGTFIKGQKIVETEIKSGEEFQIGDVTIEFHIGVPKPHVKEEKQAVPKAPPVAPPPKPKAQPTQPSKAAAQVAATIGAMGHVHTHPTTNKNNKAKGTFAPPSSTNIKTSLKPTQGSAVEVVVFWKDRVLNAYHFGKNKIVKVGSHPDNDIILPVFGAVRLKHPLLKIENTAKLILTPDMSGEVVRKDGSKVKIEDIKKSGGLEKVGSHYVFELKQNELVTVYFGEGVELIIRYVSATSKIKIAPIINMTVNQLTWLIVMMLAAFLFLFYVFLYAPEPPEKIEEETIPPRKAQFFYKRPVEEITPVEVAPKNAQETIIDKEVAPARGEEGAAPEAKPNQSQSNKQILTADKAGKDKGIQKAQGSAAGGASKNKDVSKSGVLGVFATKGVQEQLSKAYQGSGNVAGVSAGATGSGSEAAGAGITTGAGLKEVGMGGQGTATVGIAGPKTKGRGGGVQGYGTGPLGAKKNATILAGGDDMTATGGIDKEAIRRVVLNNIRQIKACYEKGLNKDPGLYGKITIQWSIGAGGKVLDAGVKNSTMNSSEVENCAVTRLKSWKFPEPPINEIAVVSFPFVFQAQE